MAGTTGIARTHKKNTKKTEKIIISKLNIDIIAGLFLLSFCFVFVFILLNFIHWIRNLFYVNKDILSPHILTHGKGRSYLFE